MADKDTNSDALDYGIGIPAPRTPFFLKGLEHVDWGMKDRLSRIFLPRSGRTVMLAFDHGYIMGPTSGLERMDLSIPPLIEHADCLMCTRGALRSVVPPTSNKPISLRYSAGTTVLTDLNDECLLDIEDAIRVNASALAVMVAIGSKFEGRTIDNLVRTADQGAKYGIPTLGVTAVGKELTRDARYLGLACRVCAENGATFVKTYYCEEGFEKVTAACPVPIVIAGGKKLPEPEALELAARAISEGAAGAEAFDLYETLSHAKT
jgi:3-hydroxy-5-phosphonooxypentane-2,4-dione thiolase